LDPRTPQTQQESGDSETEQDDEHDDHGMAALEPEPSSPQPRRHGFDGGAHRERKPIQDGRAVKRARRVGGGVAW